MAREETSVLVIGASYGLLPAAKIAAAGVPVTVVGRDDELQAIARRGIEIGFRNGHSLRPPMGPDGLSLSPTDVVDPDAFDLAILAVQEPQVASPEITDLLIKIAPSIPIASIMNMPPPPFLARIESLRPLLELEAFSSRSTWDQLSHARITLAAPDPQAFRPDPADPGKISVTLASNFKFAPFERDDDQLVLRHVARAASRVKADWGTVPVSLLARSSIFAPMAKWPMLVTGNCRCVGEVGCAPTSIAQAVLRNERKSRDLYEAINAALLQLGVPQDVLVPFDNYLNASRELSRPSSLALALERGVTRVERIDLLVLGLLARADIDPRITVMMEEIVTRISRHLTANEAKQAA